MKLHLRWRPKSRKQLALVIGGIMIFAFLLTFFIVQSVAFAVWNSIQNGNAWASGLGSMLRYSVQVNTHWGVILFGMLVVFVVVLAVLVSNRKQLIYDDRNFAYSDTHEYGSAGLATEEELKGIAKISTPKKALGNILGQMDDTGRRVLEFDITNHGNKNICVFGAAGSGKTFSMVKPNMLQAVRRHESIIVTDPKGELYRDTVSYLRSKGYHIGVFNLNNPILSDGWDCLKELYDQKGNLDPLRADIFAATVIANLGGDITSGDIYVKGSQALLKAILLRVLEGNDYDDSFDSRHTKTLGAAYRFLVEHGAPEDLEAEFDNEDPASGHSELDQASYAYKIFATTSQNLHGNIVTTLSTNLQAFQNEIICKLTGTNDLDLTLPGKERCAYFLILPDQHDTYRFLSSLFFTYLFIDLVELADSQVTGRLKVPVNLIMDEFVNIGTIPDFDKKIATVRSREIRIMMILQDITQLQNYYERSWQSIMSNCTTLVGLGFNDLETANYFSERSGVATIEVTTETHQKAESALTFFRRKNVGAGKRQVMNADELLRMPGTDALVVFQGRNVVQVRKFPITKHPDVQLDAPEWKPCNVVDDCVSIMDAAVREDRRKQEDAFIATYNAEHPEDCEPVASYTTDDDVNEKPPKKSVVDMFKERAKAPHVRVVSQEEVNSMFGGKKTPDFDNAVDVDYEGFESFNPFDDEFNPFQKADSGPWSNRPTPKIPETASVNDEPKNEKNEDSETEPETNSIPMWDATPDESKAERDILDGDDSNQEMPLFEAGPAPTKAEPSQVEQDGQKQNKNKRKRKGKGSGNAQPHLQPTDEKPSPIIPTTPGAARVTPGGVVRPPTPGAAPQKDSTPPVSEKSSGGKADYTGNADINFGMDGMPPGF